LTTQDSTTTLGGTKTTTTPSQPTRWY
jgi:hypothetical protein